MSTIKVSKDGNNFYDISTDDDEIQIAKDKGYSFYVDVTKNGKEVFTIPADDIGEATKKGYSQVPTYKPSTDSKPKSTGESLMRGVAQGASLGFADEINGGILGAYDALTTDKSFSEAYKENRDFARQSDKQAKDDHGTAYGTGNLLGGIAVPFGAGAKSATLVGALAKGAVTGAITGGISGAGNNENDKELFNDIGKNTFTGMVLGGAAGGVGHIAKGITKAGRAELRNEWDAFNRGAKEADDIIPVFSKVYGGIKETLDSAKSLDAFRNMLKGNKQSFLSQMVESGDTPPEHLRVVGSMLNKMSDEDYVVARVLDGDKEMIDWISKQSASQGGNFHADEIKKLLSMAPEERLRLRNYDVGNEAKALAPITNDASNAFGTANSNTVGTLNKHAGKNFNRHVGLDDINALNNSHDQALMDSTALKSMGTVAKTRLEDARAVIDNGSGPSSWKLIAGDFADAGPTERFSRLQKARELLDEGIDWDKIKQGIRSPTQSEKVLMGQRDAIDGVLKRIGSKQDADKVFQIGKEIEDLVFNKTEFKGGVDPYKLKRLLGDTDQGNRFRDGLDKLRDWATHSEDEAAKKTAQTFLDKFDDVFKQYSLSKEINGFSYANGPSSQAIERLGSRANKDSLMMDAIHSPATFMKATESGIANHAVEVAGKGWSEMTKPEQMAFVKVMTWNKKNPGGDTDTLKQWYKVFLAGKK